MRAKQLLAAALAACLIVTIPGLPAYAAAARITTRLGAAPTVRLNVAPTALTTPVLRGSLSISPTLAPLAAAVAPAVKLAEPGQAQAPVPTTPAQAAASAPVIEEQVRVETADWLRETPQATAGAQTAARPALRKKAARGAYKAGAAAAGAIGLGVAASTVGLLPAVALSVGLIGSILVHEAAHLWMLRRLGDDTSKKTGQKLNPLALIDAWGTVIVPMLALGASTLLLGVPVLFGWAKPVPVDFNKLADPKKDPAKVAFAGPAVNLAAAAIGFGLAAMVSGPAAVVLGAFWKLNLALAVLNLLPLPHLDGGKILVRMLPEGAYKRWIENRRVAPAYRGMFTKLYEGPSALLNTLHVHEQHHVNNVTRVLGLVALAGFFLLAWGTIGMPLVLLMLACSYDYYCIREKIQNEKAVQDLIVILQGFAAALAAQAEKDDSIQSEINAEEVEHVLKNAFEDMIDKVVDSEGFMNLSEEEKWQRFEETYLPAAVDALKAKGMSADTPETIRRVVTPLLPQLRVWIERSEVWAKWHSPARKNGVRDEVKKQGKSAGLGGMTGVIDDRTPKTFAEALQLPELKLSAKEQAFLQLMLTEMKLQKKAPVTGRVDEMNQVAAAVTSPRGVINSVVLIGKAGVGKTAVPEKLAQALNQTGTFGLTKFQGRFLVKLNLSRLLNQENPTEALDALLQLLSRFNDESKRGGSRVVVFVDEIHQIFEHPKGPLMANLLKEPLRDGELTLIAATTEAEYKKYLESDEAFRRRLLPVRINESSVEESLRALQGAKPYYEDLYGVRIDAAALDAAAKLSKYDQEVFLPGRAFQYLTLAASQADFDGRRDRLANAIVDKIGDLRYASAQLAERLGEDELVTRSIKEDRPDAITLYNKVVDLTRELVALYARRDAVPTEGTPVVTDELVKEAISRKTGVASGQLTLGQEPMEKYLEMEELVGKRVINQEEPIHAIAEAVRANKAGLSDPNKPMGVFYLTGPTGSGKTHLAKELARFLFDDPEAVVRLDMSEYMHDHEVSKMIGSPPGYVGYGSGGQLTEKVRKKPYSVVLFDEIEKAHPAVWLLLLQVLSEGRLTDGEGRLVDFKNTLILMTSNLGMHAIDVKPYEEAFAALKKAQKEAADDVTREVIEHQKLELAQRLSAETKALGEKVTAEAFRKTYPPEFEGRLSAPPLVFNRITPDAAVKIVDLNLAELAKLLAFTGHELKWDAAAAKQLADDGFSIALGARPLQNAIQRHVTQPIANAILRQPSAGPKKITLSVKDGKIAVALEPLPARPVAKRGLEEGAAQEVFTRVFELTLKAAAEHVAPELTLELVDSWVRGAPPAVEQAPAQAPIPAAEPAVGGSVFTASHNEVERKDAGVRAAREALAGEPLAQEWLKLFVEQAKKMGAGPVVMRADGLKAAIERPGQLTDRERTLLETHFRGPAPEDEARSRAKAEALNVIGKDGRRLWFELHRALAARPGSRLGWTQTETGVRYWLELTPPAPAPMERNGKVATVDDAPEGSDERVVWLSGEGDLAALAQRHGLTPGEQPGLWYAADVRAAAAAARALAEEAQVTEIIVHPNAFHILGGRQAVLDRTKRGLQDPAVKSAGQAMAAEMKTLGYPQPTRQAALAFLHGVANELKTMGEGELVVLWAVDANAIRVRFEREAPLTEEEQARLRAYMQSKDSLRGFELFFQEGAVRLKLPGPRGPSERGPSPPGGAVSQADGQAAQVPSGDLGGMVVRFAEALLAQGEERGPTLRMTAAETLAALSTPADLEAARARLREARLTPETAAAALTAARHGRRGIDGPLLEAALERAGALHGHEHNPLKARLVEALAALNATNDPKRLLGRYRKAAGLKKDALYLALARHGGAESRKTLMADWKQTSIPALYDYLLRVDPAYLRDLVEPWRASGRLGDGAERLLTLFAVADYGDAADFARLMETCRSDSALDNQTMPIAGAALARMAARLAPDLDELRGWLGLQLNHQATFSRLIAAVQAVGEAGGREDLTSLESIIRFSPADVAFVHEMTQHDAALAWARLVNRTGLLRAYVAEGRIQAMLADTNAVVNKAALEALKLHLVPEPARAAAPPVAERPQSRAHPFFKNASPGATSSAFYGDEEPGAAAKLSDDMRAEARRWAEQWKDVLARLTGLTFDREVRVGDNSVIWLLRQAVTDGLPVQAPLKIRELAILLLYIAADPADEREAKLAHLEQDFPNVRAVYETLKALAGRRDVTMGLDHDPARRYEPQRGEAEVWLKFELPPPPAPPRPYGYRHRYLEERWERAHYGVGLPPY